MQKKTIRFGEAAVQFYFDGNLRQLKTLADQKRAVVLTDENVFAAHGSKLKGWNTIVLKAGEAFKIQATVDSVITQLIDMGIGRDGMLIGIGGGVITDLTGYIAAIYLRGVAAAFVPTTLLAMVDAAIGGKNGIDVGPYKNMVGTITQPAFILYDHTLLKTLPESEWRSGFAEVIKHAAIKDAPMFRDLESKDPAYFMKKPSALAALVQRNALLKAKVVAADVFESGLRRTLNFGHTLGHALENQYELTHGEAIALGMCYAADLSSELTGFAHTERLENLLQQYGLPTQAQFDNKKVMQVMRGDKKKAGDGVRFILLEKIGKAIVQQVPFEQIEATL
jgi:3-dehydroquinate synthase